MTAARKLKPVEANDGSYGGKVLAAFDALAPRLFDKLPAFPMSEAQRRAIPAEDLEACASAFAYEFATQSIEEWCRFIGESEASETVHVWWEMPDRADDPEDAVFDAVRYLDARGLIARHPHMENWIALVDESEATR